MTYTNESRKQEAREHNDRMRQERDKRNDEDY